LLCAHAGPLDANAAPAAIAASVRLLTNFIKAP
jgi:hypothetical protein